MNITDNVTTSAELEIETAIREILIEELELESDERTPEGHFVEDYDADSLTLITVFTRIERRLGVTIPDTMQLQLRAPQISEL